MVRTVCRIFQFQSAEIWMLWHVAVSQYGWVAFVWQQVVRARWFLQNALHVKLLSELFPEWCERFDSGNSKRQWIIVRKEFSSPSVVAGAVMAHGLSFYVITSFPAVRCYANVQKERLQEHEKWSRAEAESANVRAVQSDPWTKICWRADWYDVLHLCFYAEFIFFWRAESTPCSRWWRSHMAGIYSDCITC